ncbi:MAG: hypothetical protein FJ290_27685 [Planctomycetes bacterium]|nr:hypothetical protein [Planctomycetota bacterium]
MVTKSGGVLSVVLSLATVLVSAWAAEYDTGGPLAGYKLPLFPTQHGEKPGQPGELPGKHDADPLAPCFELNPGSPELYRNYWFKYCPSRSFFDRQSKVRGWVAPNIPGAGKAEDYAAPLYWVPRHDAVVNTGLRWKALPIVRCTVGSPVLKLDLGELEVGVYALRFIAAVPTEQLKPFRTPLFVRAKINDGPKGETNSYRIRLGYCDEFYSIAEIYFHADERRSYRAEVAVDEGSGVEMLLHEISLDDALAGVALRAIKSRKTLPEAGPPAPANLEPPKEQRLARDAEIWNAFPRVNAQAFGHGWMGGDEHTLRRNVTIGVPGKTPREIADEFGDWQPAKGDVFLVNKKLDLTYTMDDLRQGKPLPAPYPHRDDGAGLFFPDPADPGKGHIWSPIANEVQNRLRNYPGTLVRGNVAKYLKTGDTSAAREAAVALARWAYAFPTIDAANFLLYVTRDPGPYGRDIRCRRRDSTASFYPHYPLYVDPILYDYDRIFDYIKDNAELAESVGRFVPWVKTPQDVVKLIDAYLVQTTAKRILRYHYYTDPMDIANAAAVVGDTKVTDPWMEWLFSKTFIYPLPPVGIADAMITGCCRDGCEYIGSTYYAQGEGAIRVAESLERYLKAGGNPKYDLSDKARYPKPVAQCYWRLRNVVAGWDFVRIGDVCGPDKTAGHTLRDLGFAARGWEWTADPRFAFILKHYVGRKEQSDADWAKIEEAAAKLKRAPWLDLRSRVMPMWAGVLESGLEHDDPRFRRAAYVRVGFGWGHQHADTMDLQVVAQGCPATIDGGQRSGYSSPSDGTTRVHNLVEVDGRGFQGYSWVRSLADAPGARYLMAEAEPPEGTTLFRRQVALIDVDEGHGSHPLPIEAQKPGSKLPGGAGVPPAAGGGAGILPANSYVFDVFRVAGGKTHTYCFHGTVEDDFQWNVADAKPVPENDESEIGQYLGMFKSLPDKRFAGTAPDILEATWRQTRDPKLFGNERMHRGPNYSDDLPRRFTRLHLLDAKGAKAMRGSLNCRNFKYDFACLMAQRQAQGDSARPFVALIEPFVGEPFIVSKRLLEVNDGSRATPPYRAVAIEVKTKNGHKDICFADGPVVGHPCTVPEANMAVCAQFAYYSTDNEGMRQATMVGGAYIDVPGIRLRVTERYRSANVVKVDYLAKTLWIDQPWPATTRPAMFEIGVPGHWTTYTALDVRPDGNLTRITVENGADYFRSGIEEVNGEKGTVRCALNPTMGNRPGINKGWVASNDEMTTFWRADIIGDKPANLFKLTGAPVTKEAFGKAGVLRLWEYGVGDTVRQSTFASVRRVAPGQFELTADVDVTVTLPDGKPRTVGSEELAKGSGVVKIGAP